VNESGEETSISFTRDEHSTPANPRSLTEETTASKPPPTPPRAPPQVFAQNLAQGLHMPRSLYQFLSPPCRTCSAQVHIAMRRVASYAFETKATRTRMHTHTHTHTHKQGLLMCMCIHGLPICKEVMLCKGEASSRGRRREDLSPKSQTGFGRKGSSRCSRLPTVSGS